MQNTVFKWLPSPKIPALTTLGLVLLSACTDTSDRTAGLQCYNPAVAVLLDRGTAVTKTNLHQTQFDDFLKGYQPTSAEISLEEKALILHLEQKIKQATHFTGSASAAESYSDPIDLMEEIMANDEVNNFTLARSQMEYAIENHIGCRYSNQNVKISHDDDGDGNATSFNYLIDYNFVPVTSEGNEPFVSRTIIEFGSGAIPETLNDTTDIFYSAAASITTYSAATFTSFGYMTPQSVIASWSLSETESLTISKDYKTENRDSVEYTLSTGMDFEGIDLDVIDKPVKRLKFVIDYGASPDAGTKVEIFTSDFERALVGPNGRILRDPTASELEQLETDFPEWNPARYKDPNYDADAPIPAFAYTGTRLPHRQ